MHKFTLLLFIFNDLFFLFSTDPKKPKVIVSTKTKNDQNQDDAQEKSGGGGMNVPLVISIVACVLIIIIATVLIVYRKKKANRNKHNNKNNSNEDEKAGFFGGAGQNRRLTSPRKDRSSVQEKMIFQQGLPGQRDSPIDCGYLSGGEQIFIPNQQPTYVTAFPGNAPTAFVPAGQQYINWPMQPAGYAGQPHMANMAMYPYKQSVEQINLTGVYYPKSGGEG